MEGATHGREVRDAISGDERKASGFRAPASLIHINAFAQCRNVHSIYPIEGVMACLHGLGRKDRAQFRIGNGKLKALLLVVLFVPRAGEKGRIVCHIYGLTFSNCHSYMNGLLFAPFRMRVDQ